MKLLKLVSRLVATTLALFGATAIYAMGNHVYVVSAFGGAVGFGLWDWLVWAGAALPLFAALVEIWRSDLPEAKGGRDE